LFFKLRDGKITKCPTITVSFKVPRNLDVNVFYKNMELPLDNFKWILQTEDGQFLKCERWTKFENLVSHLQSYNDDSLDVGERSMLLINFLKEALDSDTLDAEKVFKIKFSLEQLELLLEYQIRYSN